MKPFAQTVASARQEEGKKMKEKKKMTKEAKSSLIYYLCFFGAALILVVTNFLALYNATLGDMLNNPYWQEFKPNSLCTVLSALSTVFIVAAPIVAFKLKRKTSLLLSLLYGIMLITFTILFFVVTVNYSASVDLLTVVWIIAFVIYSSFFGMLMNPITAIILVIAIILSTVLSAVYLKKLSNTPIGLKKIFAKKIKKR